MTSTMAGRLPLHEMVRQQLDQAREKIASTRSSSEAKEKVASAQEQEIDLNSETEIEKLASAFDEAADLLVKEASDSIYNGAESKQGGQQLPTMNAVGGTQSYKKDGSKKHAVPTSTPLEGASDGAKGNKTLVQTDENRAPGSGKAYPAKGVLKTAGLGQGFKDLGEMAKSPREAFSAMKDSVKRYGVKGTIKANKDAIAAGGVATGGAVAAGVGAKKAFGGKEKKSSAALEYVLGLTKQAESNQGGMVLSDEKPGNNPKQPTSSAGGNEVRRILQSNEGVTNMKKIDGKRPQKRMLSEVLEEPAMSRSSDNKVHENLRSASQGGVKIAAAKALLQKIAEEGCTCEDKGECRYCKMKAAMKNKKAE